MAGRWTDTAVRWVSPASIHLTLRFLGNTEDELLPKLAGALDSLGLLHHPFELKIDAVGCFPNPRRPRVIWVGLEDPQQRLAPLQQGTEALAQALGCPAEGRAFHPHLTLGRVRERRAGVGAPAEPWFVEPVQRSFEVGSVELIESVLGPSGARYSTLHETELSG